MKILASLGQTECSKCQELVGDYLTHLLTSCRNTAVRRDIFWSTMFDNINVNFAVRLYNLNEVDFTISILEDSKKHFQQPYEWEIFQDIVYKLIDTCLDF